MFSRSTFFKICYNYGTISAIFTYIVLTIGRRMKEIGGCVNRKAGKWILENGGSGLKMRRNYLPQGTKPAHEHNSRGQVTE
jgi:hypothetical protein